MAVPFCLRLVRARHHVSNISAFKVRKAVRTLARMCDVPYHRQPLTPQLRHHMAASVAQLVEHRSRKAGVTGSSPVAGSIAQDSRLWAAFLLPISSAHPPIQAQRRRQLPYSTKSPASRNPQRNRDQRGLSALLQRKTLTTRTAQPSSSLLLPVSICKQLKADLLDRLRAIARELERGHMRLAGNKQRKLVVGKIAGNRGV